MGNTNGWVWISTGEGGGTFLTYEENSRKSPQQDQNPLLPPIDENSVGTTQKKVTKKKLRKKYQELIPQFEKMVKCLKFIGN